jgi:hypothetical protein
MRLGKAAEQGRQGRVRAGAGKGEDQTWQQGMHALERRRRCPSAEWAVRPASAAPCRQLQHT